LVAVKELTTQKVLLMCDECQSQWTSPVEALSYKNALTEEIFDIVNATAEEVNGAGWKSQ